jgi:two-component system sensor histidine kinase and response regulator WspE
MSQDHDGDLSAFSMQDLFRMEADGQARTLTDGLLAMERGGGDDATIESLMRAAHSIKGAAAIVGLDVVVQLAHCMEDAFVAAQRGQLQLTPARIDVLLGGVDLIVQCAELAEDGVAGWLRDNALRIGTAMQSIAQVARCARRRPCPPRPRSNPMNPPRPRRRRARRCKTTTSCSRWPAKRASTRTSWRRCSPRCSASSATRPACSRPSSSCTRRWCARPIPA